MPILPPGSPLIHSIALTTPAAGAEIQYLTTPRTRWRLIGVAMSLITDANAANRTVRLQIAIGGRIYRFPSSVLQAASLTYYYQWFPGYPVAPALVDGTVNLWLPPDLSERDIGPITTLTTNIQVGDQYGTPFVLVQEWIEP